MRRYRVNNIFYSLQGEGRNTGRAAVFIRFAGCNLRCPFCDTEFDSYREVSAEEIITEAEAAVGGVDDTGRTHDTGGKTAGHTFPLVVLTGGEPTLQVDEAFVDLLHQHGYEVAMESNGTRPAPKNLDWLTVSPKDHGLTRLDLSHDSTRLDLKLPNEIKIVFDENTNPEAILSELYRVEPWPESNHVKPWPSNSSRLKPWLYLQPCDTGDAERNKAITQACVEYIKQHPQWRLSLQTHKLIDIE